MNAKELRETNTKDLLDRLVALRREQFSLRVQQATGQQARSDQVTRVRRDIARLKTVLNERERQDKQAGNRG